MNDTSIIIDNNNNDNHDNRKTPEGIENVQYISRAARFALDE
jgi:hypothetical protein